MISYIWVMNMASRYQFSDEEIKAIEQARRENKDKRAEARLKALELRAKGGSSKDVAEATGFCSAYLSHQIRGKESSAGEMLTREREIPRKKAEPEVLQEETVQLETTDIEETAAAEPSIAGKYAGGVFCNLPDGAIVMCRHSFHYEDSDFKTGDTVMVVIQRYDEEKKRILGKIVGR